MKLSRLLLLAIFGMLLTVGTAQARIKVRYINAGQSQSTLLGSFAAVSIDAGGGVNSQEGNDKDAKQSDDSQGAKGEKKEEKKDGGTAGNTNQPSPSAGPSVCREVILGLTWLGDGAKDNIEEKVNALVTKLNGNGGVTVKNLGLEPDR